MDLFDIKNKIDKAISNPVIRNEAQCYSVSTRLAVLPDKVIERSWFYRLLSFVSYYFMFYFHALEIVGLEKLDQNQGCLLISSHSTHDLDLFALLCSYDVTGRVVRVLIHRYSKLFPFLQLLGFVPGERKSALSLLKSGFWVVVAPGGIDEGMNGHENPYKLYWPKNRKGFAHIATQAQVPIVPIFLANTEEMFWNPVLSLFNLFRLVGLFCYIYGLNIPIISPILRLSILTIRTILTMIQIPIPAKVTFYIGDPVRYDMSKDSIDDVVERSHNDLQSLINQHQPYGKSYSNAIKQRYQYFIKHWKRNL